MKSAIYPTRSEDYPEWYLQVVKAADLAEHSVVRGAMVIKPWGYGIWENIQKKMDGEFKKNGVQNAYFPLFVPLSFFQKEAEHVEGFAKECAIVTHHRLTKNQEGILEPASLLDEPLVVRPTSEMIIGYHFSQWIKSYRDLPLRINQWANIVRWEMRTRLFLRTTEILWQEGHTAHVSAKEADEQALQSLDLYCNFLENTLAIPVMKGKKSVSEKFPGAEETYTVEAMMQDRKALQACTSHFLGQNFSKSCNIQFQDAKGEQEFAWTTSWGSTTRLIGAILMVHSDDDGLILPPKVATSQIVLLPIIHDETKREEVLSYSRDIKQKLEEISYDGEVLRVLLDERDMRGGEKNWSWIKKGVPLRVEIGPRDVENNQIVLMQRTKSGKEKQVMKKEEFLNAVEKLFDQMHTQLFEKAQKFRDTHIVPIEDTEEFYRFFTPGNSKKPEIHGGFASVYFSLEPSIEEKIKQDLGVTLRCIPFDRQKERGECIFTGKKDCQRVIFAKAY